MASWKVSLRGAGVPGDKTAKIIKMLKTTRGFWALKYVNKARALPSTGRLPHGNPTKRPRREGKR